MRRVQEAGALIRETSKPRQARSPPATHSVMNAGRYEVADRSIAFHREAVQINRYGRFVRVTRVVCRESRPEGEVELGHAKEKKWPTRGPGKFALLSCNTITIRPLLVKSEFRFNVPNEAWCRFPPPRQYASSSVGIRGVPGSHAQRQSTQPDRTRSRIAASTSPPSSIRLTLPTSGVSASCILPGRLIR